MKNYNYSNYKKADLFIRKNLFAKDGMSYSEDNKMENVGKDGAKEVGKDR